MIIQSVPWLYVVTADVIPGAIQNYIVYINMGNILKGFEVMIMWIVNWIEEEEISFYEKDKTMEFF